ncbi:MAG: FG-GAP repeat domain-containing protein [Phycisphaeraceae bacterium]
MSLMNKENWEITLLDADLPVRHKEGAWSNAVGDIDGDGNPEIIVGGWGAMMWYRPATADKGLAHDGCFNVGSALEDLDGDGRPEIVVGYTPSDNAFSPDVPWKLAWLKPTADIARPWDLHVIDDDFDGAAHDILFADVDGDGVRELVCNRVHGRDSEVRIYKPGSDPSQPWRKHIVQQGRLEEGLAVSDFDGDGRLEIASGVSLYTAPEEGPFAGPWRRQIVAPDHREMCRVAAVDITGNGRDDLVIVDSEYFEGQLSWFENRTAEDPDHPWREHRMERGVYYGHSLHAEREHGRVRIVLGEMAGGGWEAPYNYDARVIEYTTINGGEDWNRTILSEGAGTHEATLADIDSDGEKEFVGKEWKQPKVHIFKKPAEPSPLAQFRHRFIDLDKPEVATDILAHDVDGDGREDIICGSWWYHAPDWTRYRIPGIGQVINACDIDGDGKAELIAIRRKDGKQGYGGLGADLVWLKAIDPFTGKWEIHDIGTGTGDWPHGSVIAPFLPGGKLALVTAYHSAHADTRENNTDYPDLWEIPDDPTQPWPRRPLAEILHGEELQAADLTGDGTLDILAGSWWLENKGDGTFATHRLISDDFYAARLATADLSGNGKLDVVLGEEVMDYPNRFVPFSRLVWCEQPDDPRSPWTRHVIDTVRCAHSVATADLDGDGETEVICGEHDPFYPYRNRCKLFVYKKADPAGRTWKRYQLDDRFEHHDGTKIINLGRGRKGIISHGWNDSLYVHLWEPAE